VPATLEAIFNMPPLTQRDAKANNVTSLASLAVARTDTPAKLPDLPVLAPAAIAAARAAQPAPQAESAPVDGGNLPGFLHIALKAKLEKDELEKARLGAEPPEAGRSLMMDNFTESIRTRGDARVYLETNLPGLLTGI
jgi:phospholipase C